MKTRTKKLRKVREQNSRAFRQKGLAGLTLASEILGFPDALVEYVLKLEVVPSLIRLRILQNLR